MKRKLKIMIAWIKKNYTYVLGTLSIIGGVFLLYFVKDSFEDLKIQQKKIDIAKKQREIGQLEGQKSLVSLQVDATEGNIKKIDSRISTVEKSIEKKRAEVKKLSIEQKLKRFNDLGY